MWHFYALVCFFSMMKIVMTARSMAIAQNKKGNEFVIDANLPEMDEPATTPNEKKA